MMSWMLRPIEGAAAIASRDTVVPVPIFDALNTSDPPATPIAVTVSSVVMSPVSAALTVLTWLRFRNTPSSVFVPEPALVTVIWYGPPTRRPRAL